MSKDSHKLHQSDKKRLTTKVSILLFLLQKSIQKTILIITNDIKKLKTSVFTSGLTDLCRADYTTQSHNGEVTSTFSTFSSSVQAVHPVGNRHQATILWTCNLKQVP